ncbi:universal stress protein [Aquimarina sp. W85]|uniref:universal stress protein n=1 Tax=Aquimarina rhodophyticola TaxID=3342246 RepID=UPI00366BBCB3
MQKPLKILLPTDFSDNAWNAIQYAVQMYKGTPCQFDIVNVYDVSPSQLATTLSSQRVGYYEDLLKQESEAGLHRVVSDIIKFDSDCEHIFTVHSRKGTLISVIKEMTCNTKYENICMGTKGATGIKTLFLGSTTHAVVKNNQDCPILVIPEEAKYTDTNTIAFATDFERIYYKAEIDPIKKIAKRNVAKICMLHIYDTPSLSNVQNYNSGALDNYFKNFDYDFYVLPNFDGVAKGIESFIEEEKITLLAMIYYKHSFLETLMREAVVKKITFGTKVPFLIIPSDT